MDEIKKHKSPEEAWTVLRGRVYNISPYLKFHPGGKGLEVYRLVSKAFQLNEILRICNVPYLVNVSCWMFY